MRKCSAIRMRSATRMLFLCALACVCWNPSPCDATEHAASIEGADINSGEDVNIGDQDYLITLHDTYARPGHLIQCEFRAAATTNLALGIALPLQLSADLIVNNTIHDTQQYTITNHHSLRQGFDITLRTPSVRTSTEVRLLIILRDRHQKIYKRYEYSIPTLHALRQDFLSVLPQLQHFTQPLAQQALPRLRAEQIALLLSRPHISRTAMHDAAHYLSQLTAYLAARPPYIRTTLPPQRIIEGASYHPADASWQPYRLYLPPHTPTTHDIPVIICCVPGTHAGTHAATHTGTLANSLNNHDKAQWQHLPTAWIHAAADHGYALLQIYQAGDSAWNGVTPSRLWMTVDQALTQYPQLSQQLILCSQGAAAWTAIRAAQLHPQSIAKDYPLRGVLLFNARYVQPQPWAHSEDLRPCANVPCALHGTISQLLRDWTNARPQEHQGLRSTTTISDLTSNECWRWLDIQQRTDHTPTAPATTAWTPAYWDMFAQHTSVITGSGEHLAAHERNLHIQQQLQQAWVHHAHSNLPVQLDSNPQAHTASTDFIYIGTPNGNSALQQRLHNSRDTAPPITWDSRSIHYPGGSILLSDLASLRLCWKDRSHTILVIDGAAALPNADLQTLRHVRSSHIINRAGRTVWSAALTP